ncbi:hypothetical protein LEP1GSC036_3055 [Leptospira weilii str. 2006001853]|uniref:Uncharacterized protein n=1 Tax=Leptospira weilii str. 2006001853 TaxID=1001589 RepID=A0A828YZC9_9LEPT|nr:hypothetical protein LEP1GSC036_3055 [Leptospira weilii str. 2006001853]
MYSFSVYFENHSPKVRNRPVTANEILMYSYSGLINNVSSVVEIWDSFFCKKLEFKLCKSILKCGNYNKSRIYEQILKIAGTPTFRKFFLSFNRRTHVNWIFRF